MKIKVQFESLLSAPTDADRGCGLLTVATWRSFT